MSKVYKKVLLNGETVEKMLEEYVVFNFDDWGNIIPPEVPNERYEEYDENGFNSETPAFAHVKIWEKPRSHFDGKRGQLVHELDNFDRWVWKDCKDKIIWAETEYERDENIFDASGRLSRICSSGERFISFEYDGDSDRLVHVNGPDREAWFEYDGDILIHKKSEEKKDSDENSSVKRCDVEEFFKYDENEQLIQEKCKAKNKNDSFEKLELKEYDSAEHLIHEKDEDRNQNSEHESWSVYDAEGRLIKYRNRGRAKDNESEGKIYEWDNSYEYTYEYDESGKLIRRKTKNADGSGDGDYETVYEYDSEGRLVLEKRGDDKTIFKYDDAGHLIHEKKIIKWDDDDESFSEDEKEYEYDSDGHLICEKNNGSWKTEKRWDSKGHLIFQYSDVIDSTRTFEWDDEGNLVCEKHSCYGHLYDEFHWDKAGRCIYVKDLSLEKWIEYDSDKGLIRRYGSEYDQPFETIRTTEGTLVSKREGDKFLEFDFDGYPVHFYDGKIHEWYEYEFYDFGLGIKKKTCWRETE